MVDLIFLDSYDLINCVEKHRPCSSLRLANDLRKRDAALVLTFSNLLEAIPRTAQVAYGVEFARRLERVPHVFVPHTEVSTIEFTEAVAAFQEGRQPRHVLPTFNTYASYVCTFAPGAPPSAEWRAQVDLVPLSQHVRGLLKDGGLLDFSPDHRVSMQKVVEQNRSVLGSTRTNKKVLAAMTDSQLTELGLNVSNFAEFFEWLYRDPKICPGWRLLQEVFQEFRSDVGTSVAKGDVPDMSHIYLVPYVRATTLDRKWREYVRRATHRLLRDGLVASYAVLRDLAEVRSALSNVN